MATTSFKQPLPGKALRWTCTPTLMARCDDGKVPSLVETVGQPDALDALRLGLDLYGPGYHVFLAGPPGLGRTELVRGLLDEMHPRCALPKDRVYVNNFRHPERPRLLELPRGTGRLFADAVAKAGERLADEVRRLVEDETYAKQREALNATFREKERTLVDAFERLVADHGFTAGSSQSGPGGEPDLFYVVGDRGVSMGDLDQAIRAGAVPPEKEAEIRATHATLRSELIGTMRRVRVVAGERQRALEDLEQGAARRLVEDVTTDLRARFTDPAIAAHLDEAKAHFVARFGVYARALLEAAEATSGRPDTYRIAAGEALRDFQVNLLLDTTDQQGCAVVVEGKPTWTNLFGQVERESDGNGGARSDFLLIRAGSLLRADSGYLLLYARDVLAEEGLWEELKRVLRDGRHEIRVPEALLASSPTVLHPDPIPVNVKVVLIGDEATWYAMRAGDPEFADVFKVRAVFEGEVERTEEALRRFAGWFRRFEREESRRPLDAEALALVAEEAVREAGRQDRISVRFSRLADLAREAGHLAELSGAATIGANHVRVARAAARRRHGIEERRVREAVDDGLILVQTSGTRVGQVNGLAVYDFGEHRFGKVARITAAVGAGQAGVVNVERMVDLSGASHDKGVLILSGYLRETFGADRPLAFTASIVFEQSYGGVDGDSATCAEVFATLSALARVAVRQDLAVTGSMNQHGDVQAVGGVTDKIEGFFDLCAARGLTGTQGVVIPRANARDLMLRDDVVEACAAGKFAVYAIDRVEQGIELLTGVPAGVGKAPGRFAKDSLYARVAERLDALAASGTARAATTSDGGVPAPAVVRAATRREGGARGAGRGGRARD
ncbi:MAG: AAA family ATPase [Planctomycetia bacterium]|nr:AAA family ATPase [Planctomycetia bacterium]